MWSHCASYSGPLLRPAVTYRDVYSILQIKVYNPMLHIAAPPPSASSAIKKVDFLCNKADIIYPRTAKKVQRQHYLHKYITTIYATFYSAYIIEFCRGACWRGPCSPTSHLFSSLLYFSHYFCVSVITPPAGDENIENITSCLQRHACTHNSQSIWV